MRESSYARMAEFAEGVEQEPADANGRTMAGSALLQGMEAFSAEASGDAAGERASGKAESTAFNPLEFPLCWTFPGRLSISPMSAWVQHIPFAFAIVQMLRPKCIVELGVQLGDSFLAFCQASKMLGLETRCYGVDHWQGDPHTGPYGSEVLTNLRDYHDPRYGGFSQLVPSLFDDAVKYLPDGAIDLLHIDGYHTYEASRHDFETWRPKLSSRSVVLFHDINVREKDFGVWKLWQELADLFPHFEFLHGHGLGVLVFGGDAPEAVLRLAQSQAANMRMIRDFYFALGCSLDVWVNSRRCQNELSRTLEELADCRGELAASRSQLEKIVTSRFWRLRESLVSTPGLKQAIRYLTRKNGRG